MKLFSGRLAQHRIIILLFVFVSGNSLLYSQQSQEQLVLMCLAAHPDDEDGATLAYYAKLHGVKTYSVFFTRGEGGQNEIGSELYDDLALIRTKETIEAAKIIGTEPYFLGFPDFGFSKTAKETFGKWGSKDDVLAKLVLCIRSLKPDIIITNHDTSTTKPNRQHGNHQAVGIVAYEAFVKAADASFHPEQFRGNVTPWQTKKLYFRMLRQDSTIKGNSLAAIDATQKDSSGTAIEEYAIESLHKHRSQGMEGVTLSTVSDFFRHRRYLLAKSDKQYPFEQTNIFSGITRTSRTITALQSTVIDTSIKIKLQVSPGCVPLELPNEISLQKIYRKFTITLMNRTWAPVAVTLKVTSSGTMLFSKLLYIANEKLTTTVDIVLRKERIPKEQVLKFEVLPVEEHHRFSASANVTMKPVSAIVPKKINIGVVKTYDTTLEEVFNSFNVNYSLIDSANFASGNLNKYSTIVLDLRTYEFRQDARMYSNRLLEYAQNGGNIVCFYHKRDDWNGKNYAPYPITLTTERVTEEDARVNVLLLQHSLLTTPNTLEPKDWDGWLQERSIYLPSDDTTKTSSQYERILGMNDEDDTQPLTSLLSCKYGKGSYTYVSLVLYRQLRILNEGAVKLLFNLISSPKH